VVTRRAVLRVAGASAVAGASMGVTGALAGCGTRPAPRPPAGEPPARPSALRGDVAALNQALEREHETIAAYTAGIPLLTGTARAAAQQFLSQEFSHAAELSALIRRGGGKPGEPSPNGYPLGNPRTAQEVLALLHRVEREAMALYLEVLPLLQPGEVRATVASILANEAQHLSVIRARSGLEPVPAALVTVSE
jgi:rubrerythrin